MDDPSTTDPQLVEDVTLTVKIPRDVLVAIDRAARDRLVGRGRLVEHLLRYGLDHLADPSEALFRSERP